MGERPSACYSPTQLRAWLAETTSTEDSDGHETLLQHLEACARCRESLEALSAPGVGLPALREALRVPRIASQRLSAVMAELSSSEPVEPSRVTHEFSFAEVQPWIDTTRPGSVGRFADFDLLECVGRGGMGIVFRAFDASLDRPVAVKLMLPGLAHDEAAKQRFFREARSIAAVRHPHVVAIHAVAEFKGLPYLVTEFIEGQSLIKLVRPQLMLDADTIQRIGVEIAEGLDACHQVGVIHRDIKPSNVLLDQRGAAKITDFGLATIASSPALTVPGQLAGTPGYLAPERLAGAAGDARSDLFSLGCVLYALVAGAEPFASDSPMATMHQIAEREPPALRSLNPRVPVGLEEAISRLMAKRPEDRPPSARAARDLLLQGDPADASTPGPKRGEVGKWGVGIVIAALGLLALIRWGLPPRATDGATVVETVEQLEQALASADDGDVIQIRADEFLETNGLEVTKSITIAAAPGFTPTVALIAEPDHDAPLLHVIDTELTLRGITLEDDEIDSSEYCMVCVDQGRLVAHDCRFETNAEGAGVGLFAGSRAEFVGCQFFSLEGIGIHWEALDDHGLQLDDCLHVGEIPLQVIVEGDADLSWMGSDVVATHSVMELELEGGHLHLAVERCRMQASEAIVLVGSEPIAQETLAEQVAWYGEHNHIFGQAVAFAETEASPEWTQHISSWAVEDLESTESEPLFVNELDWVAGQLLNGEPIEDL